MEKYKWIIWFPKKWNKNFTHYPSVYYGHLEGEIFMTKKHLYNIDLESINDGYQPIDENFKKDFHYEFFDSKDDAVMVSEKIRDEYESIRKEFRDKMENFHTKISLKKMKNKIRKLKLDKINEQI